jgi:hypothetical protein
MIFSIYTISATIYYNHDGSPDYERINEDMDITPEIVSKVVQDIAANHRKIIDDWCKAYMAQLYEEGHEIKPGNFTLNEQHWSFKENNPGMRYWFEKGVPHYSQWISVEDKLPEDDEPVLAYHQDDFHITVGYFEAHNVSFYIESDGSKFYTDDGWETEIPWAQKGKVTHWMTLPQPPKK